MNFIRKNKLVVIVLIAVIILSCVIFVVYNNQRLFIGEKVKEVNQYKLDIEKMNGKDTHTFNLYENDKLKVHFVTVSGFLKISIKDDDNNVIYSGDGVQTQDFVININKDGEYTIIVEARYAKGEIFIQKAI